MQAKNVAVLYGGTSAEREVSLKSGEAIAQGLTQAGFNVTLVDTKHESLETLTKTSVDCVFIALHGRGGEDGNVQGALEIMGLPYTGSKVLGSALSMDKNRSKQMWQGIGIPTAPFVVCEKAQFSAEAAQAILAKLGSKVMVKPANEGSSIGMSIAEGEEQLTKALHHAFQYDDQILVEAWIDGPEYTVAILDGEALPAIHMETPREFYDYEAKYQSTTTLYHCPSGLSDEDEATLKALALRAFRSTGAQGWGRVDVMRNSQGQWQVLEVNTVPGMTQTSLVPKAAKQAGYDFSQLVTKIVETAMEHK